MKTDFSLQFKCQNGAHDGIEGVEEPTTCNYVVTVRTNKICQRPELKILSQKKLVPITCQPLLGEEEYSHYTEFHTKKAAKSVAGKVFLSVIQKWKIVKNASLFIVKIVSKLALI